jgi:acyl-CoA synthetase (AMP-forming)/AMP-acid ligase II
LNGKDSAKMALRLLDAAYTFGDLQRAACGVAHFLMRLGCSSQDRVILLDENSFFWVAAYLGILKAGLVCVPLPAKTISSAELNYIVSDTGARVVFAQAAAAMKHRASLAGLHLATDRPLTDLPEVASLSTFASLQAEGDRWDSTLPSAYPERLAALMFTSGSTGRPRGVMITHANIIANTESIICYLELTAEDVMMTVLPFHYCFGASLLHTHLRVGGALVIDTRFTYPDLVLDRMIETGCTGFAGVPSHFQILLRNNYLGRRRFPNLRHIQQAGGYLAPSFIEQIRTALPETRFFVMYGQTEATARLSYLPPEYLDSKTRSIGKGVPGVILRVLNESGDAVQPGETGEIVAEGANVAKGYWRCPEESAISFRNGKLYTGDIGTVDAEGFIYVVDRAKDFLKCGGRRVSCRDLEERMQGFDELLEAAVVGVPDQILGEAVKVFVVPRNPTPEGFDQRFAAFCRERFVTDLVPREIVVVNGLPRNTAGKVLKSVLKGQAGSTSKHIHNA